MRAASGKTYRWPPRRGFVILITVFAYIVALEAPATIFEIAIQYAFSGYAALSPLLIAALFWKRSTKWGALASTLWVLACVVANLPSSPRNHGRRLPPP